MPKTTIVEIASAEQAQMLAKIRRARYGHLLALHILLLCAAQRSPSEIATMLFCSRSTVYRVVKAYRNGHLEGGGEEDETGAARRQRVFSPTLQSSGLAILTTVPCLCGWCRTRCACPKTAATCRELLKVESALWTFVRVDGVEPTNNAAERALRHAVQWRKTSYGTESATGSHFVEHILTVVATCRQQHRNSLEYLTQCCQSRYEGTLPPSLLPQTRG